MILNMQNKMFKIEKTEMINKTFRIPSELLMELQQVAKEQKISVNKLVIQCCTYALQNLEK